MSDSRTVFRITGKDAQEILMKGCTIDLHPSIFKIGFVANTLLANTPVIIQKRLDKKNLEAFDIFVLRSFAYHLWLWLEDASKEYLAT